MFPSVIMSSIASPEFVQSLHKNTIVLYKYLYRKGTYGLISNVVTLGSNLSHNYSTRQKKRITEYKQNKV